MHVIKLRSFVNLRPLKADFSDFGFIASCSVVQPSKERSPHEIWLTTAARRSIFVVKKRVSSQHRHLFATGRVIKAPKKITLYDRILQLTFIWVFDDKTRLLCFFVTVGSSRERCYPGLSFISLTAYTQCGD